MLMKDLSLKEQIVRNLGSQWVNGGWVERFALDRGYKASNGSRRARELANQGRIERKDEKGSVWYRRKIIQLPPAFKEKAETQSKLF